MGHGVLRNSDLPITQTTHPARLERGYIDDVAPFQSLQFIETKQATRLCLRGKTVVIKYAASTTLLNSGPVTRKICKGNAGPAVGRPRKGAFCSKDRKLLGRIKLDEGLKAETIRF